MTRYHDGHVRSWWVPVGLTPGKAFTLATIVRERMGGHPSAAASGYRHDDYVSVTRPSGWREEYGGSATIKVRGCEPYRRAAREHVEQLLATGTFDVAEHPTADAGAGSTVTCSCGKTVLSYAGRSTGVTCPRECA